MSFLEEKLYNIYVKSLVIFIADWLGALWCYGRR